MTRMRSLAMLSVFLWSACASPINDTGARRVELMSDGWALIGDLLVPESSQPAPGVLLLNKAAGDRVVYSQLAHELARRGLASLSLDLRGHGESVNLGTFVPDDEGRAMIAPTERDVIAAVAFLRRVDGIDPARIGVVGASYSGEEMMVAARVAGYVQAYVALSPGSLSDESIRSIDSTGVPWLYVASKDEPHLMEVTPAVQQMSHAVETIIIPGTAHATRILESRKDMAERIAIWLRARLANEPL